jgi:hypothetical protein
MVIKKAFYCLLRSRLQFELDINRTVVFNGVHCVVKLPENHRIVDLDIENIGVERAFVFGNQAESVVLIIFIT